MSKKMLTTQERNALFKAAAKAEKRVMIAQDVLEQLKLANIQSTQGTYFKPQIISYGEIPISKTKKRRIELQEILPEIGVCNVCALGALFYSTISINNHFKLDVEKGWGDDNHVEAPDDDLLKLRLGKLFSQSQMCMIESAFEGRNFFSSYEDNFTKAEIKKYQESDFDAASYFQKGSVIFNSPTEVLIAIMNNIIENGGTFVI